MNITCCILDHIFQICPSEADDTMVGNFERKTKNDLNKNPIDLEKLHPDFSE